jgi:2,5-diketo-D-gluconate reductase B
MTLYLTPPAIGFGTFGRTGDAGQAAIEFALETGYRHIDTAQSYDTEAEVGRAFRASGLPRDSVFITTKIGIPELAAHRVRDSLAQSLEKSGLDHFDLVLAHWPVSPGGPIDMPPNLEALAEARGDGLTRLIGVSNFTIADLEAAIAQLGPGALAVNQFELHAGLQNRRLAGFCKANDIHVTCYCPLAQGRLAGDPVLGRIAAKYGAVDTQIALAFLMAQGYSVIPTSSRRDRIAGNFAARDIVLDARDRAAIEDLDRGLRVISVPWGPKWDQGPQS